MTDTYDPSTDKLTRAERRAREAQRAAVRARKTSLELLMTTVLGRKFLWDFLAACHVFSMSYTPGSFDATAFREGERNVGQLLLMDLQRWCPRDYLTMTRENSPVEIKEQEDE